MRIDSHVGGRVSLIKHLDRKPTLLLFFRVFEVSASGRKGVERGRVEECVRERLRG